MEVLLDINPFNNKLAKFKFPLRATNEVGLVVRLNRLNSVSEPS
jgi:hypothetical protein